MKYHYLLVLVILVGFSVEQAVSDIVRFTGAGDQYDGEMIYHVGVGPIGKINDYVEFTLGSYSLLLSAPNSFFVSINLNIDVHDIEIELSKYRKSGEDGCTPELKTEWDGLVRKSKRDTTLGTVWHVTIPEIKIVGTTDTMICSGMQGIFAPGSCTRHAYVLSVETDPPNASIWIDNNKTEHRTPATNLKGTYCDGQKSLHILTRLDGRVTCSDTYSLYPNVEIQFSCEMKKIEDHRVPEDQP